MADKKTETQRRHAESKKRLHEIMTELAEVDDHIKESHQKLTALHEFEEKEDDGEDTPPHVGNLRVEIQGTKGYLSSGRKDVYCTVEVDPEDAVDEQRESKFQTPAAPWSSEEKPDWQSNFDFGAIRDRDGALVLRLWESGKEEPESQQHFAITDLLTEEVKNGCLSLRTEKSQSAQGSAVNEIVAPEDEDTTLPPTSIEELDPDNEAPDFQTGEAEEKKEDSSTTPESPVVEFQVLFKPSEEEKIVIEIGNLHRRKKRLLKEKEKETQVLSATAIALERLENAARVPVTEKKASAGRLVSSKKNKGGAAPARAAPRGAAPPSERPDRSIPWKAIAAGVWETFVANRAIAMFGASVAVFRYVSEDFLENLL